MNNSMSMEEIKALAAKQAKQRQNPLVPKEFQNFRSFAEMVEFANGPTTYTGNRTSRDAGTRNYGDFHDFRSWPEAMKAAKCGWPEGTAKITRLAASLTDKILANIKVPEMHYHEEGSYVDVERYADGDPDCLMMMRETEVENPGQDIIRLFVNVSISGCIDVGILQARGAAIVALVQALELVGKRVELVVGANAQDTIETMFVAKQSDEPIQIDQLAFSVGAGDSFRRIMFSCWECAEPNNRTAIGVGGGYGQIRNCHYVSQFDVVFPTMIGYGDANQFTDPKAAEAWVYGKLKELGVELTIEAK